MSVNLCAQEGEEPRDVVMHFDVRFRHDNIVSLSRKDGVWIGSGNHDTNYNMFVPGTVFRIEFLIREAGVVTVYCQGKFHSNFVPKVSLEFAKFVVAWCDVEKVTHCYFLPGHTHLGGGSEGQEATALVGHCLTPGQAEEHTKSRREHLKSPHRRAKAARSPQNRSTELDKCASKVATTRASRYFYDALMGSGRPDTLQEYFRPDRRDPGYEHKVGKAPIADRIASRWTICRLLSVMSWGEKCRLFCLEATFGDIVDLTEPSASAHQSRTEDDAHDRHEVCAVDTSAMGKLASFFAPRRPRDQNVRSRGRDRRRHRQELYG